MKKHTQTHGWVYDTCIAHAAHDRYHAMRKYSRSLAPLDDDKQLLHRQEYDALYMSSCGAA